MQTRVYKFDGIVCRTPDGWVNDPSVQADYLRLVRGQSLSLDGPPHRIVLSREEVRADLRAFGLEGLLQGLEG